MNLKLPPPEQSSSRPFVLSRYLRLNDAIEQFTADMAAADPGALRHGRYDIRYIIQRQLFFATFADEMLDEYFVACQTGGDVAPDHQLSAWQRRVAPYFRNARPEFDPPQDTKTRILRYIHHSLGRPSMVIEDCGRTTPKVLFLVIHPKFVRYLKPIANALAVPYAFLAVEDSEMFATLRELGEPRVHIEPDAKTLALIKPEVSIYGSQFKTGFFDAWFTRLNVLRRALTALKPDCIVVPEGNAAVYELANQSTKGTRFRTVCIQQGWAPIVHPGFRNMSYSAMCVWGERLAQILRPHNPKQRFVVTGSHVIGSQAQGEVEQRKSIAFFLQNGAYLINADVWRSMLALIEWAAVEFVDYEIRVREHPGEPLNEADLRRLRASQNVRLMPPRDFTLDEVFSNCRVAIAVNSTTVLEAVASGVVPLILDTIGLGPYSPDLVSEGAAVEVTDFLAARDMLRTLLRDDQVCASFADKLERAKPRLFAHGREDALKAIVAEIERPRSRRGRLETAENSEFAT